MKFGRFFFETILKFFSKNILLSSDCIKIELLNELNFEMSLSEKFDESIRRKFFFDLKSVFSKQESDGRL